MPQLRVTQHEWSVWKCHLIGFPFTTGHSQWSTARKSENVPQLQRVINRRKLRQLRAECTEINKQNCVASSLFLSHSITLSLSFSELEARNLILKITRQGSCSLNKFSSHVLVCFCGVAVMAAHTRESKGCAHVFRITKEKLLEVHTHECILAGYLSYSLARALQSYPAGRSIVLYLTGSGRRKAKDRKARPDCLQRCLSKQFNPLICSQYTKKFPTVMT